MGLQLHHQCGGRKGLLNGEDNGHMIGGALWPADRLVLSWESIARLRRIAASQPSAD